jgi:hypothetical protein
MEAGQEPLVSVMDQIRLKDPNKIFEYPSAIVH